MPEFPVKSTRMQSFLRGYRLIGTVGLSLGLVSGLGYGFNTWGWITLSDRVPGVLVSLMGLGLISGAVGAWGEVLRGRRDRAQWHKQRQGYEAIVATWETQLAEQQQAQDVTKQQLQTVQADHAQLQATQQELTQKHTALTQEHATLSQKHAALTQEHAALTQEYQALVAQQQKEALNCKNAEAVLEECARLEEEYTEECARLAQDNTQLREQIKKLKQENWQLREYPNCSPSQEVVDELEPVEAPAVRSGRRTATVSQLTGISGQRAVRALKHLGFSVENQTGSHIKLHRTHTQTQTCVVPDHPEVNPVTLKKALQHGKVGLEEFLAAL